MAPSIASLHLVSILVLVDQSLGAGIFSGLPAITVVSILVLVDQSLGVPGYNQDIHPK